MPQFEFPGTVGQFIETPLEQVTEELMISVNKVLSCRRHGHLDEWIDIIRSLPEVHTECHKFDNDHIVIGNPDQISEEAGEYLRQKLLSLHPWRKGPFNIFGINIDAEWQSNLKWNRLKNYITDLKGRTVLDVGCGNGYYIYRMLGAGANYVFGVDPSQLFTMQFNAIKQYIPTIPATILPLRCEEMPIDAFVENAVQFDTVFSMGILYHRKKPLQHLHELKRCLKAGGELVMETLIIESDEEEILMPENTYAKMPNVW